MVDVEDVRIEERTDIDKNGNFYRYKVAYFKVDGYEHSIRISMKDFDEGRAPQIIRQEAEKIASIKRELEKPTGKGTK